MAGVNWASVLKKAQACMNSPAKKREINAKVDLHMLGKITLGLSGGGHAVKTPEEAAEKFIEVLVKEIQSHAGGSYASGGMGPSAIYALTNLNHGTPYRVGDKYYIDVNFEGDLARPSLAPTKYDGIGNIAALLNSGYTAGHRVYGVWESHSIDGDERIASLTSRGGAHFIESAVDNFMGNYSTEYGVEKISTSDAY